MILVFVVVSGENIFTYLLNSGEIAIPPVIHSITKLFTEHQLHASHSSGYQGYSSEQDK